MTRLFLSLATVLTIFTIYFAPFSSKISTPQNQELLQDSVPIKTTAINTTLTHNHTHTHKPGEFCAFDDLQNKHPHLKQKQDSLENILYRVLKNGQSIGTDRIIYTIPVVVHVVHNNGAGNIPFTQVQTAIQHMNDAFANVGYYNPNTGVDVEIQFCLAQRDPMGNTSNGMTQTVSTLSNLDKNTQDLQLKNLIRWNPSEYVNIWTVGNIIGGVAGYAYLPSAHGSNVDGIVLEAGYMGTSPSNTAVLIHEMGHYLGLYHPFQGGCTNNDCLLDGDQVCDTPPDNTTSRPACGTPPNSCTTDEDDTSINNPFRSIALGGLGDQPDLIRGYMDYSNFTCYDRFTQGQKDRMRFFLTGTRASLLTSQGCVPACTNPINIGFAASATTILVGTNVTFSNTTTNATTYEWFNNSASFATTINANLTFNTIGTYTIRLNANNGDPNCFAQDSVVITVTCPVQANFSSSNLYPAPGEPLTLTNNSTNATTYTWTVDGVPFSNLATPNYTFGANGTYTICLTAGNGLCSLSYCQNYLVYEDTVDCGNTFLRTLGTTGTNEFGKALEQAPDKGFFLAGGKSDSSVLIKLDASANPTWQRTFKLTNTINESIIDLKIDSDSNIIAIGYAVNGSSYESFAFKYNYKTHTILWAKTFSNPSQSQFLTVHEQSAGGSYFITGQTATNGAPGSGCDGLILELDRNTGATLQIEHYNLGSCETFSRSIIHNNLIYATGRYNNAGGGTNRMRQGITEFDFTGAQNWSRLYITDVQSDARLYASDILVHNDSLVALGNGDDNGTSPTDVEIFLFKTDLTGQISWAKKYNIVGGDTERPRRLVLLPDGYLILGYYNNAASANDIYLIKTDFTGNIIWTKTYGTALNETSNDILVLGGSIFFVGDSEGLGGGADSDILFAKLDLNGDVLDTCSFIASLNITETDIVTPYDGSHLLTNYARADVLTNVAATANNTNLAVSTQCQSTCQEICDNGIDDDGDGLIDCYDPDCCGNGNCDGIFYTACPNTPCSYPIFDSTIAIQQRLQSAADYMVFHTPVFGDIDLDGETEVVLLKYNTASNSIDIMNGLTGAIETTIPTSTFGDNRTATVALGDIDVNDGGFSEIVVGRGDGFIQAFNHDGSTLWTSSGVVQHNTLYNGSALPVNLADFNGDGSPEVYAGYYILNGQTGAIMGAATNGKGAILIGNQALGVSQTVAIDVLPDNHCAECRGLELVAGNTVYSVSINTTSNTVVLNPEVTTTGLDGFTAVADWDNDGDLDAIITTAPNQNNSRLYVWDIQSPTILGSIDIPIGTTGPAPSVIGVGRANIADLDGDGLVEATYCTSYKFTAIENNFTEKWSIATTDGSGATGGTVYDFNGDGNYEIVYRDFDDIRILNGTSGANIAIQPCRSGTTIEYPTIGDIDGNGTTEILTMCNITQPTGTTYSGRFTVFESINSPWVPTRDVWNQYTYHYTNINDNLSIPIVQQSPHLVGGNSPVLNNFLNQYSNPEFPAADATITVDSIWCSGDSVSIRTTICNNGSNTLPYQTPITIYNANPTTAATATVLGPVQTIGQNILVDSCLSITLKVSQNIGNFYLVVNDDASLAPTYDLSTDFPVTAIGECDYTNNLDSTSFNPITTNLELGPDTTVCQNGIFVFNAGSGFASYRWQDGHPDSTYTAFESGLYWVEAINICGDTLRDSITITVDSIGLFDLGADTTICIGDSLVLSVVDSSSYVYQWSPNSNISCDTCPTVTVMPSSTILYQLVVTNSIGCVSNDSILITVENCDTLIFRDTTLCLGDSLVLDATLNTAVAYQWQDGSTSNMYTINNTGMYGVTIALSNGDSILADLTVSYTNCAIISSITDTVLCNGDSLIIDATNVNATAYQWQDGSTNTQFTANVAGSYWVHTTLTDGSQLRDTSNVSYKNCNTTITGSRIDTSFCIGSGQLLVLNKATPGAVSYLWHNGTTSNRMFIGAAGIYWVHITLNDGSQIHDTIDVAFVDCSSTFTARTDTVICTTDIPYTINAERLGAISYQWNTGATDKQLFIQNSGTYSSTVSFGNGNKYIDSTIIAVVDCNPIIFEKTDTSLCDGDILVLDATLVGGISYRWSNGSTASQQLISSSGVYGVTITMTDNSIISDQIIISYQDCNNDCNVFIPDAFTPNNDTHNDEFRLVVMGTCNISNYQLLIYNRWGQKVFESTDAQAGWNGNHGNQEQPRAVYMYTVKYTLDTPTGRQEKQHRGQITLLR